MRIILLPEVIREAVDAAAWYESDRAGLGVELLQELADVLQTLETDSERHPLLETTRSQRYRRARLNRFPYMVVFRCRENEVLVVAFSHAARKPSYWSRRDQK